MSDIRKRSIKSIYWIYGGFIIGAINVYLFTHNNWFNPGQYGLVNTIRDISLLFAAISALGTPNYLIKFFPYYQDNLTPKNNDLLGYALKISLTGFLLFFLAVLASQGLIIQKFGTNAPLLVEYFYYTLLMAFFILLFNIMEFYAYGFGHGVLNNILKEVVLRGFTLIAILLKIGGFISFSTFVTIFSLQYLVIFLILVVFLKKRGELHLQFKRSRVTQKFHKKIRAMLLFSALVVIIGVLRNSFDSIVLASRLGLDKSGIFGFSVYLISLIQAPYRSVVSITTPILSRLWKAKSMETINNIYKRSSITLLVFALFAFSCIWLNFNTGIDIFNIDEAYREGKWVVFVMGLATIFELGTGVNAQIIGTSTFWRFELWTNLILSAVLIPLSYLFTVKFGITGPALASLISFSLYNTIRYIFLYRKFGLQPFSIKTLELVAFAIAAYYLTKFFVGEYEGWPRVISSCSMLLIFYIVFVIKRNISEDAKTMFTGTITKVKGYSRLGRK